MIITISGTPGSGKSTVAKMLAEKLHAERIYVGSIRRELARKKGWTLEQLNEYGKTHPETDVDVDKAAAAQARTLEQQGKIVVDEGRMQFHFLPESIKMYIKVDPAEGARRIWKDLQVQTLVQQRNEGVFTSLQDVKKSIIKREENDAQRYTKFYGVTHRDESQYDLVIDSTNISPEKVLKKIIEYIEAIEP